MDRTAAAIQQNTRRNALTAREILWDCRPSSLAFCPLSQPQPTNSTTHTRRHHCARTNSNWCVLPGCPV